MRIGNWIYTGFASGLLFLGVGCSHTTKVASTGCTSCGTTQTATHSQKTDTKVAQSTSDKPTIRTHSNVATTRTVTSTSNDMMDGSPVWVVSKEKGNKYTLVSTTQAESTVKPAASSSRPLIVADTVRKSSDKAVVVPGMPMSTPEHTTLKPNVSPKVDTTTAKILPPLAPQKTVIQDTKPTKPISSELLPKTNIEEARAPLAALPQTTEVTAKALTANKTLQESTVNDAATPTMPAVLPTPAKSQTLLPRVGDKEIVRGKDVEKTLACADDHSWLMGQLEYLHSRKQWRIRYADLSKEDRYGGCVTLVGAESLLRDFRDGDMVKIDGYVIDTSGKKAAPEYQVMTIIPLVQREVISTKIEEGKAIEVPQEKK